MDLSHIRELLDSGQLGKAHQFIICQFSSASPDMRQNLLGELELEHWYRGAAELSSVINPPVRTREYFYFNVSSMVKLKEKEKLKELIAITEKENEENIWFYLAKGKAEIFFDNLGLAEKAIMRVWQEAITTNNIFMKICSGLELVELFLNKYQLLVDDSQYNKAIDVLDEILKLGHSEYRVLHCWCLLARVRVAMITLDFDLAREYLDDAIQYSTAQQLPWMKTPIKELAKTITREFAHIVDESADKVIIGRLATVPSNEMIFVSMCFYAVYEIKQSSSPQILLHEKLPFNDELAVLEAAGVYFSIAVGQGANANVGLFGPLPLPQQPQYSALVYAVNCESYCLVCLIIPNTIVSKLPHRSWLDYVFSSVFHVLNSKQRLNSSLFTLIKANIGKQLLL